MGRSCRTNREKRTAYRFLVGKPKGKGPLGKPRLRLEEVLKWILERYNGVTWIGSIWLRIGVN
jgi:hypothetical protein